ncbi:hypothetical protein OKT24_18370 [Aeromonas veronii]|nr:hypothetical protein [Aeromonas veronii]
MAGIDTGRDTFIFAIAGNTKSYAALPSFDVLSELAVVQLGMNIKASDSVGYKIEMD